MRLPRPRIENCCVHITHRCQEQRFLLGTDADRRQYVKRLWQAAQRFRTVRLLDYVVTSNHVHLLAWVPRMGDLSEMMRWLQGTVAGDCNRRSGREGAFWRGRFHPTLVETGRHLSRCLFYLETNMVRAGVVAHPREWRSGGYHELAGTRKRYRIIDMDRLVALLDFPDADAFRRWHGTTLDELCQRAGPAREPHWSKAFAVGSRAWLQHVVGGATQVEKYIRPLESGTTDDPEAPFILTPPQATCLWLWERIVGS